MELNRKQIKSQARILVQNKWGALFVIHLCGDGAHRYGYV